MSRSVYAPVIEDMTWSYSRLKAFEDCPYKWYLRYIRFPKAKGVDQFFADYGTFIHELIREEDKRPDRDGVSHRFPGES